MRVVLRPEARREISEAQAWYEARAVGLGFEFVRAVDAAIGKASRMPLAFPAIDADLRHVVLRRFPIPSSITQHLRNWSSWPASITAATR
ncbi:hypothetical protein [Pseudorhodoferax soli]|uniref:hypothetical protein n=1 Tax=Pseudorhodoferax soli TaxID=545864 RepID=UPI001B87E2AF|nr:hypothetical protein [Pseudorhodoferax soli]